jgi:hypothetical protein
MVFLFLMFLGRLELISVLILLNRNFYNAETVITTPEYPDPALQKLVVTVQSITVDASFIPCHH